MRPLLGQNGSGEGGIRPRNQEGNGVLGGGKSAILTKNVLYRLSYVGTNGREPVPQFYRISTFAAMVANL
jgi:hypothetical protein